MPQLTVNTTLH